MSDAMTTGDAGAHDVTRASAGPTSPMGVLHRSGLLPKILASAGVPFTELRAGDSIRHAGEDGWVIYMVCHERGWMRLCREGRTEFVPDVSDDELFVRGAF